jgi:hypothetical protein
MKAAIPMILGLLAVTFGLLNEDFDFGGPGRTSFGGPMKIPRWLGKVLFVAAGCAMFYAGLRALR